MTKHREQLAKSNQSKAKEKTKHEQEREAHLEVKVEGEPVVVESVPTGNSPEVMNQAGARGQKGETKKP
jgi:hypothetical protein